MRWDELRSIAVLSVRGRDLWFAELMAEVAEVWVGEIR